MQFGLSLVRFGPKSRSNLTKSRYRQQYMDKNPQGYCMHGFNGVSCPIGLGVEGQVHAEAGPGVDG